ncbi:MAG: Golgi transport complex subunit 6 [Pycnora praestabilis]|nr:MAG: Golgi transport complex subunit 6 [Pycnora praestabilis]
MAGSYFQEKVVPPASDQIDALSPASTPTSPSLGSGTRPNALSNKLTSVLSTSFADLDIRDALETLDAKGTENTQETRRQLRLDVQKEVIECNGDVIKEFGGVAKQLKRIGSMIANLNRSCEDMRKHISASHVEIAPVLEEASLLVTQKQQVETKQQVLTAFNAHFIISDAELTTLTSSAEPVDDRFFKVLGRVKKVHKDCQVLLGTENQRLGLEIMDQSSRNLNGAFQKLYRWTQREFKGLNLENPQLSSSIRRALRVLAERPSLFQSCLDFFAEAREHTLSDAFYTALTGSSLDLDQHLSTKPIELFAHDSLRYVGDMLAWTHSATVSEREALEILFVSEGDEIAKGINAGLNSEPWSRDDGEESGVFDGERALNQLVNRDLTGVVRVLRQRIDQVIQGHEESVLAYKIANLINFYRVTFTKLLGEDSGVLDTLNTLEESAMRQFRATMRDHITVIQAELALAPSDLRVPEFLDEALEQLKALMKSFDSSLTPVSSRGTDFQPIITEALDPFLAGCENLAKNLEEPRNCIFVLNCLLASKKTLLSFPFTGERVSEIEDTMEEHAAKLIDYQHGFFLHASGLHPLVASLASLDDSEEDLSIIPSLGPFQPKALTETSQMLDDFLPSALMDATEHLKQLLSSKMAQDITEEAAGRFCEDFEFVESKILAVDDLQAREEGNEQANPELRALFPRTGGEIRVLLS